MLRGPFSVAVVVMVCPVRNEIRSHFFEKFLNASTRLPADNVTSTSPFRVRVSSGMSREIMQLAKTRLVVLPTVVMVGGGEHAVAYQAPAEAAGAATIEKLAPVEVDVAPSAWSERSPTTTSAAASASAWLN